MHDIFSPEEESRYARHFALPKVGKEGQAKLKKAKVLVVGAGGLGCPTLQYLAAAGVGTIGIVDFDRVSASNLQRQILFATQDIGEYKAQVAQQKLLALNPHIKVNTYITAFTQDNALDLVQDYDIIVDGTDNFTTRYLVNDACVLANKINVYGAIFRFDGQVSVFNYPQAKGRGPNYRDLFPTPPPADTVPDCAEGGVLGVLPGLIGTMQATEVIKVITGVGEPLVGRLCLFDAARFQMQIMKFNKRPDTVITELITYDDFCVPTPALEISGEEFAKIKATKQPYQLLDVRNDDERAQGHCGGLHIPLPQLTQRVNELDKDKLIIIYCKTGKRSLKAAKMLVEELGVDAKSIVI